MYAAAYVNGEAQQKAIHVDVRRANLSLTASKTEVVAPGASDSFVPVGNGPVVVQGWHFTADAGGGAQSRSSLTIRRLPSETAASARMGHPVQTRAVSAPVQTSFDSSSGKAASRSALRPSSTPSYSVAPGDGWGNCAPSAQTCTHDVTETGVVEVIATVNGIQLTASIRVTLVGCDWDKFPVLRDSVLRRQLKEMMTNSNYLVLPGTGIRDGDSVGTKRETAFDVYRRPDGSFYLVQDLNLWSTECKGIRQNTNPLSTLDVKVYAGHTHPGETWDDIYGCDPVNGQLSRRGPWDTVDAHRIPRQKGADSTNGGGSFSDWRQLRLVPENVGPLSEIPPGPPTVGGMVMNADGEIWLLPPELIDRPLEQAANRQVGHWKRNKNSSCNW